MPWLPNPDTTMAGKNKAARANPAALKHYIDRAAVTRRRAQVQSVYSAFALPRFVDAACAGLEPLEFTAR